MNSMSFMKFVRLFKPLCLLFAALIASLIFCTVIFVKPNLDFFHVNASRAYQSNAFFITAFITLIFGIIYIYIYRYAQKISLVKLKKVLAYYLVTFIVLLTSTIYLTNQSYLVDAKAVHDGILLFDKNNYFNEQPQQIGLAYYFVLLSKISGYDNPLLFYIINATLTVLLYFLLINICQELFENEKITKALTICSFITFGPLFTTLYAYNDIPGYTLVVAAFYLLVKLTKFFSKSDFKSLSTKQKLKLFFTNRNIYLYFVCIFFATIIKKNTEIIFISFLVYVLIYLFKKQFFIFVLLFSLSFLPLLMGSLTISVHNKIMYKDNNAPLRSLHWVVLGNVDDGFMKKYHQKTFKWMTDASKCKYKDDNSACWTTQGAGLYHNMLQVWQIEDQAKSNPNIWKGKKYYKYYTAKESAKLVSKASKKDLQRLIEYRASNPLNTLEFYRQKFVTTFGNPSYDGYEIYLTQRMLSAQNNKNLKLNSIISDFFENKNTMHNIYTYLFNPIQAVMMLLLIFGLYKNRKRFTYLQIVPLMAFIGGTIFHVLLWETRARYIMIYCLLSLLYSAVGLHEISKYDFIARLKSLRANKISAKN